MKTKEEILSDKIGGDFQFKTFTQILTSECIENIYKAMEQYAIEYHESKVKALSLSDVIQSLPPDEILIELAKNNCMLHRTSDELGFLAMFDLNDLRQFCTKLLKGNVV